MTLIDEGDLVDDAFKRGPLDRWPMGEWYRALVDLTQDIDRQMTANRPIGQVPDAEYHAYLEWRQRAISIRKVALVRLREVKQAMKQMPNQGSGVGNGELNGPWKITDGSEWEITDASGDLIMDWQTPPTEEDARLLVGVVGQVSAIIRRFGVAP